MKSKIMTESNGIHVNKLKLAGELQLVVIVAVRKMHSFQTLRDCFLSLTIELVWVAH